jgi:hypothetical protein
MRKAIQVALALACLASVLACAARQDAATASAATAPAASAQAQQAPKADAQPAPDASAPRTDKDKQKDKKKKDNKKDSGGADVLDTAVFSQAVANDILGQIRDGLEGRMQRRLLNAFDADKMSGYLQFEDQIEAMFRRYDSFRVNFRIAQTTTEGAKGIVVVDADIERIPREGGPERRREQIRFELERGRKGWRIVDFAPRSFFM